MTQGIDKVHSLFRGHLHLADTAKLILNGVLNRHDILDRRVDLIQAGVQGCAFTAAGRAGYKDHTMRTVDNFVEYFSLFFKKAELFQCQNTAAFIQ